MCSKNVKVRYHICREAVANKKVKLKYCPTLEMVADILTKMMGLQKFTRVKKLLLIEVLPVSNRKKCIL